jgi:integrase
LPGLGRYASEIGFDQGLSTNSFAPTLAGVNHLLRVARDEELRAIATGREHGIDLAAQDLSVAFAAIEGTQALTRHEKDRLRQSSLLAAVTRMRERLDRPRGVRGPRRGTAQIDIENKEFPFTHIAPLLAAATCDRDRCLWALLVGGGLRLHEALNMRVVDLDVQNREVFVIDPDRRRIPADLRDGQALRFKGRAVAKVYMFEPLRTVFWEAAARYLRSEFVPNGVGGDGFLFVKRDSVDRGRPLVEASDTAMGKSFKAAVRRCGAPGPPEAPDHVWTLHSLRHAYGVYMFNYIPVQGGPGLRLTEVQMLMGHASPQSTVVYARHDRLVVEARVEVANALVFEGTSTDPDHTRDLPRVIADRLREVAERLERPVSEAGGHRS